MPGKDSGCGEVRWKASSIGVPANSSGVIVGNIARAASGIPLLVEEAEATTSYRTTSGWRIASCKAVAPPML